MHIASLWVTDNIRGTGYGTKLITTIEQQAISRACHSAYVFTYDFQAHRLKWHLQFAYSNCFLQSFGLILHEHLRSYHQ
ncbi:GNAT family N-acetyltransferase [Iningainema tapete]|uniref:GNAT family N-acetyltransferase n=1 Tax=Iningainema tapete BLCC-T55 TaxID=2748662 RepID=A0A8J6XVU4_9CYAN|nr:GNAT family N-acetyltransferase [Iningainema tapete BLCC-T55]